MVVFTPDSIKHVNAPGFTVGDYKCLWSLVINKLFNNVFFAPFSMGVPVHLASHAEPLINKDK